LKQGVSVLQSRDDSYSNHIHAHDLARLVLLTLFRGKPGRIYNCCDESEMRMGDYFDLVADRFSIPRPPRVDRDEAERTLSPMLLSFMNESRRVSNVRMKRELMSDLKFPSVEEGLVAATTSSKAL
jgi:nucleoside-diphosphate-sugar epimerase